MKRKSKQISVPSILPPVSDFVFKMIFGDERNADILIDFLQAVLDLPPDEYEGIEIINPFVKKEWNNGKEGILDVKLHTKSKHIIDVEIQVESDKPMRERITFYVSKMITGQIGTGEDYEVIKRAISIVITDYVLIDDTAYRHRFRLYDKEHNIEFTNIIEVNTLELPKLPAVRDSEVWNWLKFLKAKEAEDFDMLAQVSPALKKATVIVKQLSADEEARLLYEAREKERMDRASVLKVKIKRARAEGIAEGETKGQLAKAGAIAHSMKTMNYPIADIIKLTGLTAEEIENL